MIARPQARTSQVIALLLAGYTLSCASGGGPPEPGGITVTATTSGVEIDPDGYNLLLNGVVDLPFTVNGSATRTQLEPGSYTVGLANVAPNCTVAPPTRTVVVTAGETSAADFGVTCFTTLGTLRLQVNFSGFANDFDHFVTYQIDTLSGWMISAFDSTFSLLPRQYTVTLGEIDQHCSVPNGTTQTAGITAGVETVVQFEVVCSALTGWLYVDFLHTGSNPDADGYDIALDGAPPSRIDHTYAVIGWAFVTPGLHTTVLSDIAPQCSVTGSTTRQHTVVAGQITRDTMKIDCP